jgi:tripartite-type tricarboxylate transporter receptor subunit TctC
MIAKFYRPILVLLIGLFIAGTAIGSEKEPFFKGKVIVIVVATSPGGGFDTYSRAIARHMGKYIPGNPTIIIQNRPGAGTLIGAKHVLRAKRDGLTIGNFIGDLALAQLLGQRGMDFDIREFEWIGVPVKDNIVCALTKASGITSLDQWIASKTPVKLGGTGRLRITDNAALALKSVLGLPVKIVSGYGGTTQIRLAAERGELAGGCWQWESIKVTWRHALENGDVNVIIQLTSRPHPELPNVPLGTSLAKTKGDRMLLEAAVQTTTPITRLYALPPGTPEERVKILRKAFMETLRDPDFLAEAKKSQLDIDPGSGEEVKAAIEGLLNLDPAMVKKLKRILLQEG